MSKITTRSYQLHSIFHQKPSNDVKNLSNLLTQNRVHKKQKN